MLSLKCRTVVNSVCGAIGGRPTYALSDENYSVLLAC